MNTINQLIERAHSQAKAMGWWDEPRNSGELLMLVISECGEALEAHRMGKMGDLKAFDARQGDRDEGVGDFASDFKELIKDSFSDELADIVIRCADLMGHRGYSFDERFNLSWVSDTKNVGENLHQLCGFLGDDSKESLCAAIMGTFWMANTHNIDLWRHIDLRFQYLCAKQEWYE